jgi:ubiquinone/menaquinone biosynthesis C-methylase UbiE
MTTHDEITRDIYQKQHERISGDTQAQGRIDGMYSSESFGVDATWFEGKSAVDIGCGNIGALLARFKALGVSRITGIDIGTEWIESLRGALAGRGLNPSTFELRTGSVTEVPYPDATFDFVAINGVLIHLENMQAVRKGFEEGARVTAPGGYLFTSWGPCGGLMQGVIMPAVRAHYRKDDAFKAFIDNISPQAFQRVIGKVVGDHLRYTGEDLNAEFLNSLFGEDFCVFLQNFIQAPTWLSNECTPEYVEGLYAELGFVNVRRLGKFIRRTDIRKFFAPLHHDIHYDVSKILYGDGYVQYIGTRP